MNELMIFNNPEFGEIRTIEEDGKVLFCGSDVAKALGYNEPHKAVARHCRGGMKRPILTNGGEQEMSFIPESDLYRLVFSSKLPTAEKFTDWVTGEVLPSIRKHGAYLTPETLEAAILNPDTMIRLCTALKDEQDKRKALEEKREAGYYPKPANGDRWAEAHSIPAIRMGPRKRGYETDLVAKAIVQSRGMW